MDGFGRCFPYLYRQSKITSKVCVSIFILVFMAVHKKKRKFYPFENRGVRSLCSQVGVSFDQFS